MQRVHTFTNEYHHQYQLTTTTTTLYTFDTNNSGERVRAVAVIDDAQLQLGTVWLRNTRSQQRSANLTQQTNKQTTTTTTNKQKHKQQQQQQQQQHQCQFTTIVVHTALVFT
jgi:hypothetical protein